MIGEKSFLDQVWVVVPAAGKGSRMNSEVPKQYLPLLGKACLQHTLNKFSHLSFIAGICVALSENDKDFYNLIAQHPLLHSTIGGTERSDSVLNGLRFLVALGAKPSDWVLVHDAARPCVRPEHIINLVSYCAQHNCSGILATPIADTVKKQNAHHQIEHTVDRSLLWQAHTPQCARFDTLIRALETAQRNHVVITDEASALEQIAEPVQLVLDASDNIKITRPEDLCLAEKILQGQLS